MPVVKIGLLGCGRIAQLVHLDALRGLAGVELAAIAEPDPERRREAVRRAPQAAVVADYREALAMPQVAAVVICLPNARTPRRRFAGFFRERFSGPAARAS